jgi:hypothetical protein
MPISYMLNKEEGYLEVKCQGLISDLEILSERLTYMGGSDWVPGTPEFIDLSEVDFPMVTPAGVRQRASCVVQILKEHGLKNVKVAFFSPQLLPSVLTSLYSDYADKSIENVRVFEDRKEAVNWLLG